jgi:hypothetical protein
MYSTITDPTVGTFAGFIAEPTDVLTTDIRMPTAHITEDTALISLIRTEDIIPTPTEPIVRTGSDLIVGMCVEFTGAHIDGVTTDAIVGSRQE